MSWLSHFTNWVGEKAKVIVPVVTGVAGFAAGMIPGIGGTVSKFIDKLGNKISGGIEAVSAVNDMVGSGGGTGTPPAQNPASPSSPAVQAVTDQAPDPTKAVADLSESLAKGKDSPSAPKDEHPASEATGTLIKVGALAAVAALIFGGRRGR